MLNYMLLRNKDRPILEKSQGQLRWILLDEAHTYTGSAAAETRTPAAPRAASL